MTDKNLTEMVFIIDASGSMTSLRNDTVGGFDSLIEEQKKTDKELGTKTKVSTILFNHQLKTIHNRTILKNINSLNYYTFGATALLDAVGDTINNIGIQLAKEKEQDRPNNVLVFIITDGEENCSKEYTNNKIKEMIKHQEEKYNWTFSFLGANQDSFSNADGLGISAKNVTNFNCSSQGVDAVYKSTSKRILDLKLGGTMRSASEVYNSFDPDN